MSVAVAVKTLCSEFDLSAYLKGYKPSFMADAPEKTNFASGRAKEYAAGLVGGTMSFEGFYDRTLILGADVVLATALGANTSQIITCGPEGLAVGARVAMMQCIEAKYEVNTDIGQLAMITAELPATGAIGSGVSLHPLETELFTSTGTGVDAGAASANGGFAHLHVTATVPAPSMVVKVQHSTNNSTWVDLITFAAFSVSNSQRLELAAGTTVNRYLRTSWTYGGGGSVTLAVAFCRN